MHKLIRFYYKNRLKVWVLILGIVFLIAIIQILNIVSSNNLKVENDKIAQETTLENNVVSYDKESQSIISSGKVQEEYKSDFGNLINQFFTYCIEHKLQLAYELLSKDTKESLYPTETLFEEMYYSEKFKGNKQFSFQSWINTGKLYIYQVKIFDNMLMTGKTNDTYYEDFVAISPEDGEYKLNINNLIGIKEINQTYNNKFLQINVKKSQVFMDYEIYTFDIKNLSENTIKLDSMKKTDNIYVVDEKGNKYSALLQENTEEEMIFNPKESRRINIKFSDTYREGIVIDQIVFEDIVTNYPEYKRGEEKQRAEVKMEL